MDKYPNFLTQSWVESAKTFLYCASIVAQLEGAPLGHGADLLMNAPLTGFLPFPESCPCPLAVLPGIIYQIN